MAGQDSFPDVFDRIADTARQIHAEQDTLRPADPEAIAAAVASGGLAAAGGRIAQMVGKKLNFGDFGSGAAKSIKQATEETVKQVSRVSKRRKYLGNTPGKASRTGREVIERMREQGKIVTTDGEDMLLWRAPGSDKVQEVPLSKATWDTTQSTPWITGTTWASITVLGRPRCGNGCSMRTTTNCSRPATTPLRELGLAARTRISIERWTCGSVAAGPATRG